jgi:hypothetical protein
MVDSFTTEDAEDTENGIRLVQPQVSVGDFTAGWNADNWPVSGDLPAKAQPTALNWDVHATLHCIFQL